MAKKVGGIKQGRTSNDPKQLPLGVAPERNLKLGREARDKGMAQVLEGTDLTERVSDIINQEWGAGEMITGEDIRVRCIELGVQVRHHNAWGAAINSVVRSRQLVALGKYVPSKVISSHAHKSPLYAVNNA